MKSAIVTGASSGIGKEISKTLIEAGYKVFGIGRNFKEKSESERFMPIELDLMETDKLCERIKEIRKENEIEILINNAGVGYFGLHEELNAKKIHEMVMVNIEVPMILSQLLLRELKERQGYIINISSVTAKKSNTYGCAYGATKAAITSFSNSLFDEARKYGIKVTAIHPDMTKSNFYRNADFCEGEKADSYLYTEEIAECIKWIIEKRSGVVISDITIKPQKHQLGKNNK